ncbi:hypothetical protein AEY54_01900 [Helicobacter pylori]|nr:hypothetical protein AEY54_01900 [Helicobacter pylori]
MRKQASPSQLFTQTKLESVVFNSKYLIFNILKIQDANPPFKNAPTLYYLDCKNAFNLHFIFFHKL